MRACLFARRLFSIIQLLGGIKQSFLWCSWLLSNVRFMFSCVEYNDLTYIIRGAAFRVHSELGPGLFEKVYHNAMISELKGLGVKVESEVSVDITSRISCTDSYQLPLYIQPSFTFYAPNAFTPNGDGINERFIPVGIGWQYEDYDFTIWDRWGELIYQTNSQNEPWDETYLGSEV